MRRQRFLVLKVAIFRGDTLDGDEHIKMVRTNFQSNTMLHFLEDPSNYDNLLYWLEVFASRLQDYTAESDILSFLATELDGENNCAKVWTRIERYLSSTDIKTARVMMN